MTGKNDSTSLTMQQWPLIHKDGINFARDALTYQSLTSEWLWLQYWSNRKAERKFQICKVDATFVHITY